VSQSYSGTVQASIEVHQPNSPLEQSFRDEEITAPITKTTTPVPTVSVDFDQIDVLSSHSDEFDILTKKSYRERLGMEYKCHEFNCDEVFESVSRLENHQIEKHDILSSKEPSQKTGGNLFEIPEFDCAQCSQRFLSPADLEQHLATIHQGENQCLYCDKVFDTKRELKYHSVDIHDAEPMMSTPKSVRVSPVMQFSSAISENSLANSPPTNSADYFANSSQFTCFVCGAYSTNKETEVQLHLALKHQICWLCDEKQCFDSKNENSGVFHHLKHVHNYGFFDCDSCKYAALSEDSLLEHKSSHKISPTKTTPIETVPLTPGETNKQTGQAKEVGYAERMPKKKVFQCYKCDSMYEVKFSINKHFKKKHQNQKYDHTKVIPVAFHCYKCEMTFFIYGQLESHFLLVHKSELLDSDKVMLGDSQLSLNALLKRSVKPTVNKGQKSIEMPGTVRSEMNRVNLLTAQNNYFTPKRSHSYLDCYCDIFSLLAV
jgi:hypothetical protein